LDCRNVWKTYAFHDALQAGKQKKVDPPYSPDLAPTDARSWEYGGLPSVSQPEEHHERAPDQRSTEYDQFLKRPLLTVSRIIMNVTNSVLWRMAIILKANIVNLFVSSVLFVFWYHSPNFLDTPRIW
jgi:hypothetical protein